MATLGPLARLRHLPRRRRVAVFLSTLVVASAGVSAWAIVGAPDLQIVAQHHAPVHVKTFQDDLNNLVRSGRGAEAFILSFERGDEIFGAVFNALDGSGVNVGNGERYTHVPRADLKGPGQWGAHFPPRATGPNAAACFECHNVPFEDGAGLASGNVHRDPQASGSPGKFIQRNAPHLFGSGGVQRLAEEMTDELRTKARAAIATCAAPGCTATVTLTSKGVNFGTVVITRTAPGPEPIPPNNCMGTDAIPFIDPADCLAGVTADIRGLQGIGRDLVVRGFQWKGSIAFIRDFNRDASNQEIGMQSVEVTGENRDGDFDGVMNELRVGDQTALAIYISAQPRPTTRQELARLGLIPALTRAENDAIGRGSTRFAAIGCASCHIPSLTINRATFSEPSLDPNFRDARFPAGQDPISRGLNPTTAVSYDLTNDQPDNRIEVNGREVRFGAFEKGTARGSAIVRLFGDLKRHDMGPAMAEQIDEVLTGASTFLTENLWGVGSTAPYLHDGRATTLTEAILLHGGEAQTSRNNFASLPAAQRSDVLAFLNNQVLFVTPEGEEGE
jgi:hypothetical protein